MDDNKTQQPTYSPESMDTTGFDSPPPPSVAPPSPAPAPASFSRQIQTQLFALRESAERLQQLSFAEFVTFLKRSRSVWLTAAGVVLGSMALVTLVEHVYVWARDARERRHELAVATVTPDRLIARCGAAAEDETKEVFPIVMRTMRYPRRQPKYVLAFSRTAEEQSDWVFLSMRDENGSAIYDTPDAKIAALPCLNSTK